MVRSTTRGGGPGRDAVDVDQCTKDLSGGAPTWIRTGPGRSTRRGGGPLASSRVHASIHCHVQEPRVDVAATSGRATCRSSDDGGERAASQFQRLSGHLVSVQGGEENDGLFVEQRILLTWNYHLASKQRHMCCKVKRCSLHRESLLVCAVPLVKRHCAAVVIFDAWLKSVSGCCVSGRFGC